MTFHLPISQTATPDADARFAACMQDTAAQADDPVDGQTGRDFLAEDPEQQRALFDIVEAHTASESPSQAGLLLGLLMFAGWAAVVIVIVKALL